MRYFKAGVVKVSYSETQLVAAGKLDFYEEELEDLTVGVVGVYCFVKGDHH